MLEIRDYPITEKQIQNKHLLENLFRRLFRGSLILTVLILGLITVYIFINGLSAFKYISPIEFLFTWDWAPVSLKKFGILAMIITSIYVTFASLLISVPISIGCAIFAANLKNKFVKNFMQSAVAVLAGIPSVVYGLVGLSLLVPWIQNFGNSSGYSILAATIVLSVMILPTILSISQDAIESVPHNLKEASFALGGTDIQTLMKVVLPIAKPGIIAAIVLGISRAFGEAMAIKMIIGNRQTLPDFSSDSWFGLLSSARALTTNIIGDFAYAQSGAHLQSLFATGMVLFIITMLVNYLAHRFVRQSSKIKKIKHSRKRSKKA